MDSARVDASIFLRSMLCNSALQKLDTGSDSLLCYDSKKKRCLPTRVERTEYGSDARQRSDAEWKFGMVPSPRTPSRAAGRRKIVEQQRSSRIRWVVPTR